MNQDEMKQAVAQATLEYIPTGGIIGVGTGSTANFFIDALATIKHKIDGTVASSEATAERLRSHGIEVFDLNNVSEMAIYVDGADEATNNLQLIKGGGGALTREKIVASVADKFICIADDSKLVKLMGEFPLPVEVIPMARSHVAREIVRITGAQPVLRDGFTTDNGNIILDIHGMQIVDPSKLEADLNAVTGVVTNGLFSIHPADVLLLGGENGVRTIK